MRRGAAPVMDGGGIPAVVGRRSPPGAGGRAATEEELLGVPGDDAVSGDAVD